MAMTAVIVEATPDMAMPVPKTLSSADRGFQAGMNCVRGRSELAVARSSPRSCALDLSKSRADDAVLDILRAHKLTGNFHVNLEIFLKAIGVFDKVTYQIERIQNCLIPGTAGMSFSNPMTMYPAICSSKSLSP